MCELELVLVVVMHEVSIASDTKTAKTVVIRFSFIALRFYLGDFGEYDFFDFARTI